jgi:VanZ family protein
MGIGVKKFIPGIAWFFVVLVLVCTPGPDLPEVGDWFGEISFDKFIHCGIFGLLALLFMWPVGRAAFTKKQTVNWFLKVALATSVFGLMTEFLQKFFIIGRSYSLLDVLADIVGSFGAFGVCYWYFFKRKAKKG